MERPPRVLLAPQRLYPRMLPLRRQVLPHRRQVQRVQQVPPRQVPRLPQELDSRLPVPLESESPDSFLRTLSMFYVKALFFLCFLVFLFELCKFVRLWDVRTD